jgi:hypothetical protein
VLLAERQNAPASRNAVVCHLKRKNHDPDSHLVISASSISTNREKHGEIEVITKQLVGHVDNSSYPLIDVDIQLSLKTPANAQRPVPVIMELRFVFPPDFNPDFAARYRASTHEWEQQVLAKGWGVAALIPVSVQADNGPGLTQGIIGLMNKGQPRKLDDWGALRAWGWGRESSARLFRDGCCSRR